MRGEEALEEYKRPPLLSLCIPFLFIKFGQNTAMLLEFGYFAKNLFELDFELCSLIIVEVFLYFQALSKEHWDPFGLAFLA